MFSLFEIKEMLKTPENEYENLAEKARGIRESYTGKKVFLRGVIEFSNKCEKDCFYCGIRKGNSTLDRYLIEEKHVLESARFASERKLGSVVLQSGEITDKEFVLYVENLIKNIKKIDSNLYITLSLGEQSFDTYKRWFDAGAERYLLRIETSDERLYSLWHPSSHSFFERLKCLENLKKIGYQTGTGVLIGAPYQEISHLAKDVMFFREFDIDMIGMGPYVIHNETPFGKSYREEFSKRKQNIFFLALKMIAVVRIVLEDVNIASTSALGAFDREGRIDGLKAGANVIMPDITPVEYKKFYKLYENKPSLTSPLEQSLNSILKIIEDAGMVPAFGEHGSSLHFLKRKSSV